MLPLVSYGKRNSAIILVAVKMRYSTWQRVTCKSPTNCSLKHGCAFRQLNTCVLFGGTGFSVSVSCAQCVRLTDDEYGIKSECYTDIFSLS